MANIYRRLSLTSLADFLPIGLLTISAIVIGFALAGRDPSRAVHEAVMTNLRAIDFHYASLQRDVLRARAGMLPSYDPLVRSVGNLQRTSGELAELFKTKPFDDDLTLHQLLKDLREGIESDDALVEEFKTRNALLQNSINVFGQTMTALHESDDDVVKRVVSRVSDLGTLMLRFSTRPDEELHELIGRRLTEIPEFDTAAPALVSLGAVIVHAKMILAVLPRVDSKIAAIQASTTPVRAEKLQSEYVSIAADAASRASTSRIMLGVVASFLSIYICVLIYRLRAQTKRLRRRLHYETIIADIKAQLVDCEAGQIQSFMDEALKRMSGFFGARSVGFAVYGPSQNSFRHAYQFEDHTRNQQILESFAQHTEWRQETSTRLFQDDAPHGSPLPLGCLLKLQECRLVVGTQSHEQDIAALIFVFDKAHRHFTSDEAHLMTATLQTFMEFLDAYNGCQERQALEHRLQHSQRLEAIGTLAGGIAHEFNNVLSAILGYGEMTVQLLKKPSAALNYVEEILKSGARAKYIVDQILTFSRKRERTVKPFDVSDAIADILPLLHVTISNHVELDCHLSTTPAVIEGNPVEIHQLAMNLCKNASQASARGQKVTIEIRTIDVPSMRPLTHGEISRGAYVCLSVKDEASGIPAHALPHIFEPFFTTNSSSGGSGLGLSAVHGIVSALGGAINVESRPGKGSTFSLYFPASTLPPLPIDSFYNERAVPIGNGEQVIIVEDDNALLELYEEKVAALGYEPIGILGMATLRQKLDAGLRADLVIFNHKAIKTAAELARVESSIGNGKSLLLCERTSELLQEFQSLGPRILKTPFSSAVLASAIFDRLKQS